MNLPSAVSIDLSPIVLGTTKTLPTAGAGIRISPLSARAINPREDRERDRIWMFQAVLELFRQRKPVDGVQKELQPCIFMPGFPGLPNLSTELWGRGGRGLAVKLEIPLGPSSSIGNGEGAMFWLDCWVGDGPSCTRFPNLFAIGVNPMLLVSAAV